MLLASSWEDFLDWSVLVAGILGLIGASAFIGTVYMSSLDDKDIAQLRPSFEKLVHPAHAGEMVTKRLSVAKVAWYVGFGTVLAAVLQAVNGSELAIPQALAVGAGWPSVVAQLRGQGAQVADLANQLQAPGP